MRTIAIINQKGGCGKTTTAINLAAVFARRGFRTLLVDMDPQSHCAAGLGIPEDSIDRDITDALLSPKTRTSEPHRLVWRVARDLDLIPSRMRLAGLEASRGGLADAPDKEHRLAAVVQLLNATRDPEIEQVRQGRYDVCLIDCPPSIGLLTYNALAAAREALIPVETSYFSLKGAGKQVRTIRSIARRLGGRIHTRVVATMHDPAEPLAKDLLRELRDQFGEAVVPAIVRYDRKVREAASFGRPVIDHAPESTGAEDYGSLCEWLIERSDIEREDLREDDPIEEAAAEVSVAVDAKPAPSAPISRLEELARRARALSGGPVAVVTTSTAAPSVRAEPEERPIAEVVTSVAEARALAASFRARTRPLPARPVAVELVAPEPAKTPVVLDSVRRLFGVRPTSTGALFVQPLALGRHVSVAGDFNGWDANAHPMRRNDSLGVFELQIPLNPGRHAYRLVVDGVWQTDEFNGERSLNDFGGQNNLVCLPQRTA